MAKRKKKSKRRKLNERCEELVKEIVKIRDDYTCQRCGKQVEGQDCHASHVIPVSASTKLAYDPLNLKVLCYHCHINFWHLDPMGGPREWFESKFPERAKYLEAKRLEYKHNPGPIPISWFEETVKRLEVHLERHCK